MRQSAAGADPHTAIGVGPERLAVAVVPDQAVFGRPLRPGIGAQDHHAVGSASPEIAERVKAVEDGQIVRLGVGRHDRVDVQIRSPESCSRSTPESIRWRSHKLPSGARTGT